MSLSDILVQKFMYNVLMRNEELLLFDFLLLLQCYYTVSYYSCIKRIAIWTLYGFNFATVVFDVLDELRSFRNSLLDYYALVVVDKYEITTTNAYTPIYGWMPCRS